MLRKSGPFFGGNFATENLLDDDFDKCFRCSVTFDENLNSMKNSTNITEVDIFNSTKVTTETIDETTTYGSDYSGNELGM